MCAMYGVVFQISYVMALFRFLVDASYPRLNDVDIPEWKAVFHCWEESARGIFTTHCPKLLLSAFLYWLKPSLACNGAWQPSHHK